MLIDTLGKPRELREGAEAWEDGRSGERVGARGRAGRRLVTWVRSGCGHASRSTRTKYRIFQQFAEEFGRVSVNTDALLGEASRDARLFVGPTTIPEWNI